MDSPTSIMESASQALARMAYLECEARCIEALELARAGDDWASVARILLPLQEARRQRRMIAADGVIRLGTAGLRDEVEMWLDNIPAGCVAVTPPHTVKDASKLSAVARDRRVYVEVLFIEDAPQSGAWRVRSFAGPDVCAKVAAPPASWRDRSLGPSEIEAVDSRTPADWFLDAAQLLGDAALADAAQHSDDPKACFQALYDCLNVVTDHEILHQRLADAARNLQMKSARS